MPLAAGAAGIRVATVIQQAHSRQTAYGDRGRTAVFLHPTQTAQFSLKPDRGFLPDRGSGRRAGAYPSHRRLAVYSATQKKPQRGLTVSGYTLIRLHFTQMRQAEVSPECHNADGISAAGAILITIHAPALNDDARSLCTVTFFQQKPAR